MADDAEPGSAATLLDVVDFYDQRFGIGFTDREKCDLVAFLRTLQRRLPSIDPVTEPPV